MDPGLHSPLFELFRRGEVPREVRVLAARGGVAVQPLEQLGLLVLLSDDDDVEVATVAVDTLEGIPRETLAGFLARADVPDAMRACFAARGVLPAGAPTPDSDQPLLDRPDDEPDPTEGKAETKLLTLLPVVDRMKLALRGSREQRAMLIRDPNKLVATAVLSCPKITDSEVEGFARQTNVSEEVLRIIGTTRGWVKNYGVAAALTKNPKTPIAISLQLLPRLNERDVKLLATDRNVPEVIRQGCRKVITKGRERRE